MKCENCGREFSAARADARFDSPACRVEYSRKMKGTLGKDTPPEKLELVKPAEKNTLFEHYRLNCHTKSGFWEDENGEPIVYKARYWFNVPLNAVPVDNDPEMPEWMNGRQYFLWRENNFAVNPETGACQIIDPNARKEKLTYVMGGEQSNMWGGRGGGSKAPN